MNVPYPDVDQVFILRFWRENADSGQVFRWRARVQNVNTGQHQIANDVETAFALVAKQLKAAEALDP